MKLKTNILLVFFASSLLYLTGCPIYCVIPERVWVSIENDEIESHAGDTIQIIFTLTPDIDSESKLGDLLVTDENNNIIFEKTYSGQEAITDSLVYIISDTVSVGKNVVLNFIATEPQSGYSTEKYFLIEIISKTPILIVPPADITANYISTTLDNTMMFDLTDEGVTLEGGDFNDGELAFVFQYDFGYCIVSPDAEFIATFYGYNGIIYTINDKEETKIQKYSGSWQDLTSETIDELYITTETVMGRGNGVQELEIGDILVFETEDGRKGALLVKTNAKISMNMTVEIKYQVEPSA